MKPEKVKSEEFHELLQGALTVGHVNVTEVNGQRIPTVLIDPEVRPDFADLFRLHGQEPGGGENECSWGMIGSTNLDDFEVFLRINFLRPATCEVKLRFELKNRNHILALNSATHTGLLALHSAMPEPVDHLAATPTPNLLIECSPDAQLHEFLSHHNTLVALRRMFSFEVAD